ncbi:hypothetical protein [Methylicorpusculum sp.]|uniref:hypothetical protein n=1 Tax=Methylicorpusculum sp. TaxID=2713644 RepID=UPI0027366FC7|nr:hypothetical protein [Methylicorpusculum sp.]MDP2100627.1 hypothetical protein [Methylobacter sp.]MDP3531215.1 hypothetical protein [Methylicorpusculum sp.]
MEANIELDDLIREVQRKLGRNVLLFQQIEQILKWMLTHQDVKVWRNKEGFKTNLDERKKSLSKATMGQIAKDFIGNSFSLSEDSCSDEKDCEVNTNYIRLTLGPIICDEDFYNKRKTELEALITERNDLIHHFLPRWDFDELESVREAETYLDEQRDRVFPEYEFLKSLIENSQEDRKQLIDYLSSDEGRKDVILSTLRGSHHLFGLINYANTKQRNDGWAVLDAAQSFIRQNYDENCLIYELTWIKKNYQCKTLKEIANKSEFFEIREEPTDKGGVRVLYRVKPGLEFDIR